MKLIWAFVALLWSLNVEAIEFINCGCVVNGDGTVPACGVTPGGVGAKNTAVTTVSASTEYSYVSQTTCTLASTSITVNQNAVTISAYGAGAKPIIVGNAASYALTVTTSNGFDISRIDWRNGTTGAVNLSATTTGGTFSDNDITTNVVGLVISAAGAANITGRGNTTQCTGAASICWNITTNGGGIVFRDSVNILTATDKTSTSLIGIRLSGLATGLYNFDVFGGNLGVEIRAGVSSTNHTVSNGEYSGQLVAGVRIRDSSFNRVAYNWLHDIDNLVAYPSGQGNAIDLIDPGAACSANWIVGNRFNAVYQGIVDQCDNGSGGGNFFIGNLGWDYRVDGISYQATVGMGYILNNTMLHSPRSLVGHAIAIQHLSATMMTAYVANNLCVNLLVGDNVQCVSLPNSANTGPIYLNNNNWFAGVSGAHLAKLDTVSPDCAVGSTPSFCNYDTLAAWQTALGGDADTTGDEANSLSITPGWRRNTPSNPADFCLDPASGIIAAGAYLGDYVLGVGGEHFPNPPPMGARGLCQGRASTSARTAR